MSGTPAQITKKTISLSSLSGPERAAIVMQELGEETASAVFREMDEPTASRISMAMASLPLASVELRSQVLSSFEEDMAAHGLTGDSLKFLTSTLTNAFGPRVANEIISRLSKYDPNKSFKLPANADPRTLAIQMERERPQTIALLLAHIPKDFAAEMLQFLPETLMTETAYRFVHLGVVSPNAIMELQSMVDELMSSAVNGGRRVNNLGGAKQTADILNLLNSDQMQGILTNIEGRDSPTAEAIRENLFTFEDLIKIQDRYLRMLLREVPNEILAPALRLADQMMKDHFFNNISQRQKDILTEELNGGPTMRRADVLAAQAEIVSIALRMESEGKISIKATEEMI